MELNRAVQNLSSKPVDTLHVLVSNIEQKGTTKLAVFGCNFQLVLNSTYRSGVDGKPDLCREAASWRNDNQTQSKSKSWKRVESD